MGHLAGSDIERSARKVDQAASEVGIAGQFKDQIDLEPFENKKGVFQKNRQSRLPRLLDAGCFRVDIDDPDNLDPIEPEKPAQDGFSPISGPDNQYFYHTSSVS